MKLAVKSISVYQQKMFYYNILIKRCNKLNKYKITATEVYIKKQVNATKEYIVHDLFPMS